MSVRMCPSCGAEMKKTSTFYGVYYDCTGPGCTWRVSTDGTGADKPTRRARMAAHAEFDRLWKNGLMLRSAAYAWMREAMNLPEDKAHIKQMSVEQCNELIAKVKAR